MIVKMNCGLVLVVAVHGALGAVANVQAQPRHLRTVCSENGWLQHNFICTKIMARVKAALCSVMSMTACANDNSALQNSLDDGGYVGPPYWIIDDAGMNITVFLNMTGYSASSTTPTPDGRNPSEMVAVIRDPETVAAARNQSDETTPDRTAPVNHHDSTTAINMLDKTAQVQSLHVPTTNAGLSTTGHNPKIQSTLAVSTLSKNTVNEVRPQMNNETSLLIAEKVSNAVALEIAKKLKVKLVEKLQSP